MTPKAFVKAYLGYAQEAEATTGISAMATLAQGALESGWGEAVIGNMLFGIKDTDGVNGNEQLLTTTEYSRRADLKFPVVISVTPMIRNGQKWFKYKVKDYFRKYDTPADCFVDHAQFFIKNSRYAAALKVGHDPEAFIKEIAAAGYATAPDYAQVLLSVLNTLKKAIS